MTTLQTQIIPIETDNRSPEEMRASIMKLEAAMMAMPEHHIEITPVHYFANGLYLREIFIPKGTVLTGKIHKTEHLCILSLGEVSVWNGDGVRRLKASTVVKSSPGTKRVLYAHEDSVWINAHYNPENITDLDKIEETYTVNSFEEIPGLIEPKQIDGGK